MDNLRGAFLMVLAMLGFALEDMFIKLLADTVPIGQILLILGLGGGTIFALIVRAQGDRVIDPAMLSIPILLRALGELFGVLGFVSAIVWTSLSSASAILQATPLVVTMGAALFLGETVGWRRWSATLVGLFGVILIIRPGMATFEPLSLLALLGVFGLATRDIATRRVPASITSMQLSCLGFFATVPAGLGFMFFSPDTYVVMSAMDWTYITIALTIGLFAYYAIVAAMRLGDISFVSPFRYIRMIFALIIGIAVFNENPDTLTLIGAAIIVASGIYTVWRERKLHRAT
jgi:drug/metabolite transporter (DMT)-like permease